MVKRVTSPTISKGLIIPLDPLPDSSVGDEITPESRLRNKSSFWGDNTSEDLLGEKYITGEDILEDVLSGERQAIMGLFPVFNYYSSAFLNKIPLTKNTFLLMSASSSGLIEGNSSVLMPIDKG